MSWKKIFQKGQELVLATASKNGEPNANVVESLGFCDGKLMVIDVVMNRTIKNLRANPKICVYGASRGKYYRLTGAVRLVTSGKYFDWCVKYSKGYKVRTAIIIKVKSVFDLEKMKKVL